MLKYFLILFSLLSFTSIASASVEYTIGIKDAGPFAHKNAEGKWSGLSVDLIDELSVRMGFTYSFEEYGTVPDLINATSNGTVDFSIAAISTNPSRELRVDFSHPYFTTTLGIMTKQEDSALSSALWIAQKVVIVAVLFIFGLYVIGYFFDKVDGDKNISNPHEGAWFALVTFTTTGYGDMVPDTPRGKVAAAAWMVASMFLLSVFTGYMASAFTVKELTSSATSIGDLYNVEVVAIDGTTSSRVLNTLGVRYETVPTLASGVSAITSGKAVAFVHDKAMLDAEAVSVDNLSTWALDRNEEFYSIAFPQNSSNVEQFDVNILDILSSPSWNSLLTKYFGSN